MFYPTKSMLQKSLWSGWKFSLKQHGQSTDTVTPRSICVMFIPPHLP